MKRASGPHRLSWPRWDQLDRYGTDLTARVEHGAELLVDRPVIGRRIAAGLLAWRGATVVIVGSAGSGKRSCVRLLAHQLANGAGPQPLRGRQVFAIDTARLTAGIRFRAHLEARTERLGREVSAGRGRLIVIVERAELLVAGEYSGGGSEALRQMLTAGGCVLPLTEQSLAEFAKQLPDIRSLADVIVLPEWSDADAVAAVTARVPSLVEHHNVAIDPSAPALAVALVRRYLRTQVLPAAAIGLLDRAAATVRVDQGNSAGRLALLDEVARQTGLPLTGLDCAWNV